MYTGYNYTNLKQVWKCKHDKNSHKSAPFCSGASEKETLNYKSSRFMCILIIHIHAEYTIEVEDPYELVNIKIL